MGVKVIWRKKFFLLYNASAATAAASFGVWQNSLSAASFVFISLLSLHTLGVLLLLELKE